MLPRIIRHFLFKALSLVFILGLTSCIKDDYSESEYSFLGKWEAKSYIINTWQNEVAGEGSQGTFEPGDLIVEFKPDGAFREYQVEGGQIIDERTGTYSMNGTKIRIVIITPNLDEIYQVEPFYKNDGKTLVLKRIQETILDTGVKLRNETTTVFASIQ